MGKRTIIGLSPVDMTEEAMQALEDRGLIIRLGPGRHVTAAEEGRTVDRSLYEPVEGYGPHKLITVTVNSHDLAEFGTHPDNEEFLLIGEPDCRPLYLVVSVHGREELERIARERPLSAADFLALRVRYNDPRLSFFVMLKHAPHGEAAGRGPGRPPSFYVTESRDLTTERFDLGGWALAVRE